MSFGFGFGFPKRLTSGGGLSPRLYLDFIGTGSLPSTVTFSRGTNATLTDSNGRVAWAPHNLLTNSEDFEAAAWINNGGTVTSNALVAPDGSTTADYLVRSTAAADGRYQTITAGTSGVVTASIYIKKDTSPQSLIWLYDATAVADRLFATVTWSGSTPVVTATTGTAATPQDAGNGWWRIAVTSTALTGANTNRLYLLPAYIGASNGQQAAFWGAQLNVGSTAQSYNSTTPKNLLGFTQEPENAAWTKSNSYVQQNLLTWSQDFDNAAWLKSGSSSVTPNVAVAPDGTITADKYILSSGAVGDLYRPVPIASGTVTFSIYVKAAEWNFVRLVFGGSYSPSNLTYIRLSDGAVTSGGGFTAQSVGNGWYRITGSSTYASAADNTVYVTATNSGTPPLANGDGTSGILVWGAQLVQGSTAGDYTQTTSAAAPTRYLNWDGTLTGRKLVETTAVGFHQAAQSISPTGIPITYTVYAKAAERTQIAIQLGADASFFDLSAGTVVSGTNSTITAAGGGWWRCSITKSPASANVLVFTATGGSANYTGDGTSGIYVSDFQLSNSASVDPYVYNPQAAAASAAYYGPRFDYNPTTLAANGLLIEEQRTNLLTYSEQFDNAAWGKFEATVSANTATSPDGATNADTLIESTATNVHIAFVAPTLSAGAHTFSVYYKIPSARKIALYHTPTNTGRQFDVSGNQSAGLFNPTSGGATVSPAGNGWYRASITVTVTAGVNEFRFWLVRASDDAINYAGDGTSGVFLYGAQLEAGSFATSYIPTVASQVTRNADSASMLGDNFYTWYNPNQGTLYGEVTGTSDPAGTYRTQITITDVGVTNYARIRLANPTATTVLANNQIGSGGAIQADLASSAITIPSVLKTTLGFAPNNFGASTNGATPLTDTSGSMPANPTLLEFKGGPFQVGQTYIRRIGYYNTRLPDSTLTALTT